IGRRSSMTENGTFKVTLTNMSLTELLKQPGLSIPECQRQYSWNSNHVYDLLKDTIGRKEPYLLATTVGNQNKRPE
ncbi:MAG: hypothetical protein ACP5IL_17785, partial [Syntrophobacteraceae bacterium]